MSDHPPIPDAVPLPELAQQYDGEIRYTCHYVIRHLGDPAARLLHHVLVARIGFSTAAELFGAFDTALEEATERGVIVAAPTLPALNSKTLDLVHRCRLAQKENNGHPFGSWSTGEQLFVALVLRDKATLDAMDYTPTEVAQRLIGDGWVPADPDDPSVFLRWLEAVRVEVAFPGFITGTENTYVKRVNS